MRANRRTALMVGATALLAGLTAPAGHAGAVGYATQAQACIMDVDSMTAAGNYAGARITATVPPTSEQGVGPKGFEPGTVRASSNWTYGVDAPAGSHDYGYVVIGSTLYSAGLIYDTSGEPKSTRTAIGGGWGNYTAIEDAYYEPYLASPTHRGAFYGLRSDGVISRWVTDGSTWSRPTAFAGFSSVKTMALISETATYDSFLAITHGGALYTIRFPVGSSTAVVKKVRSSGWSSFESIVAERCGQYGTLLTGIDKDSGNAYLYAVGHANGTATVIKSRGKLPGSYQDPVYHLGTNEGVLPLNGE